MGKKYIIEIEEEPLVRKSALHGETAVWRANGFNSLVFDNNGLDKLTPYTEPDLEQVRKEAYKDGYDAGFGRKIDASYQEGLSDAWEAARKVTQVRKYGGYGDCLEEVFGRHRVPWDVFDYSASEAIEKIRQYEQEKEEQIQIGDEVDAPFGKAIVVNIDSNAKKIWFLYADGYGGFDFFKDAPTKTGRRFPEIAAVLEKMREESNG